MIELAEVSSARRNLSFERPSGVDVLKGLQVTKASNDQVLDCRVCTSLFTDRDTIRIGRECIKPLDSSSEAPQESRGSCICAVLASITRFDLGDSACRVSRCDHESWHIGGNHCSRADNGPLTDADAFQNDGAGADKHVICNLDRRVRW